MEAKGDHEIAYWLTRVKAEGRLQNSHYKYFYTNHFGLTDEYYSGKKILDVGCGPRGSLEWADMTAERVGLDPLAERYMALGSDRHKMRYVASGCETIPFDADYFDVAASFNSLDHVDDLNQTIAEIKRVVKPGGLFLLLTELNHDPTYCEPIVFSWDIVDKFTDTFRLAENRHYEKNKGGMYDSIRDGIVYDHSDLRRRYGILSAKFVKVST